MARRPYLAIYPNDWRADPELQACSLQARGLWFEMMLLMHAAEPYGYVKIGSRFVTEKDLFFLAKQVGSDKKTVELSLAELREFQVFSTTEEGVIFSRRMVRDEENRVKECGRKQKNPPEVRRNSGGNPAESDRNSRAGARVPSQSQANASPPIIPPSGGDGEVDYGGRVPRALSEPFGFADWFFAEAFSLGLLGIHETENRDGWVRSQLLAAAALLKNGVAECQARSRRYLLAVKSKELTRSAPTVRGLKAAWDLGCVRSEKLGSASGPYGDVQYTLTPEERR